MIYARKPQATTGHHVTNAREGWTANRDAVNMLLRIFGYPGIEQKEPMTHNPRFEKDEE